MLSDEEKKAIEYLKQNNIVEIQYDNYGLESIHRVGIDEKQIILELIEKQSKEIEELKANKGYHLGFIDGGIAKKYEYQDKIKAKIEESELLIDNSQGCMSDKDLYKEYGKIEFGQSFLEKE